MIKVFVYGTLMKNGYNHQYYLKGQKYMGQAILSGYALYNLGSYPGIIADETEQVLGELYEIDLKMLRRLDILEGNGSLYIRQPVKVRIQDEKVDAEVYVWNGEVRQEDKIGCYTGRSDVLSVTQTQRVNRSSPCLRGDRRHTQP